MTKITIYKDEKQRNRGFAVAGHAGYAKDGKEDIVCAAVSILSINTCNSITKFAGDAYSYKEDEKKGRMQCILNKAPSKEAAVLLSALELGFSQLAESYPKNVKITVRCL